MGRPPMKDEDKRKLISFRLSPRDLTQIETYAKTGGRSVAAEIERRLLATIDLDEQGVSFFAEVSHHIATLERQEHGNRWHSTLKLWAAVKELLRLGPVDDLRPSSWQDDPEANEAYDTLSKAKEDRLAVIEKLRTYGLVIDEEPGDIVLRGGLFAVQRNGLLPLDGGRAMARRFAEEAPEGEDRTEAVALLDRLAEADARVTEAQSEWSAHLKLYWDDEDAGKLLARNHLQQIARERRARGEPVNLLHLYGEWPN